MLATLFYSTAFPAALLKAGKMPAPGKSVTLRCNPQKKPDLAVRPGDAFFVAWKGSPRKDTRLWRWRSGAEGLQAVMAGAREKGTAESHKLQDPAALE